MASIINTLSLTLFFSLTLFARPAFSADKQNLPPSPSPQPPSDEISPPPPSPSPSPAIPNSPPAPPPVDLAPGPHSQAPSPGVNDAGQKKTPSQSPAISGDVSHADQSSDGELEKKGGSGGLSGGTKAGVAIGVIAVVCVVGIGAVVYKKRQQNIQRSQYGNAARREML
ncbi:hypothetical protein CASFOL_002719 [Castilleja foliolosa]|uniref:Uncharacterized protein n=1 Tax=Castilleja foliolosa TaxID=1961234 RepID=A0ABD3EF31_9LAMI